jgi:hypothetical protein
MDCVLISTKSEGSFGKLTFTKFRAFSQITHKFGVFFENLNLMLLILWKYKGSFVKLHGLRVDFKFEVFSKNLCLTLLILWKDRESFVKLDGLRVDFNKVRGVFCKINIHKVQGFFRKLHVNLECFRKICILRCRFCESMGVFYVTKFRGFSANCT